MDAARTSSHRWAARPRGSEGHTGRIRADAWTGGTVPATRFSGQLDGLPVLRGAHRASCRDMQFLRRPSGLILTITALAVGSRRAHPGADTDAPPYEHEDDRDVLYPLQGPEGLAAGRGLAEKPADYRSLRHGGVVGPSGFEPESSGPEPPRIDQATPRTRGRPERKGGFRISVMRRVRGASLPGP